MKWICSLALPKAFSMRSKRLTVQGNKCDSRVQATVAMYRRTTSSVKESTLTIRKILSRSILRSAQSIIFHATWESWTIKVSRRCPSQAHSQARTLIGLSLLTLLSIIMSRATSIPLLISLRRLSSRSPTWTSCWKHRWWMIWSKKCRCQYSHRWVVFLLKKESHIATDRKDKCSKASLISIRCSTLLRMEQSQTLVSSTWEKHPNRFASWHQNKIKNLERRLRWALRIQIPKHAKGLTPPEKL